MIDFWTEQQEFQSFAGFDPEKEKQGKDREERVKKTAAAFLALLLTALVFFASAESPERIMDRIIAFRMEKAGQDDLQGWVDTDLAGSVDGNGGWYLIALDRAGYSFDASRCRESMREAAKGQTGSITKKLRMALTMLALGMEEDFLRETMAEAAASESLMPLIFARHLANNGVAGGEETAEKLLALQKADGGWAVIGESADPDCTAMALQALSPLREGDERVQAAAERGIAALSRIQLENGGFSGMGLESSESCAQVLLALSCLGIDGGTDDRFVKSGGSVKEALLAFQRADGGFAHSPEEQVSNETATVQAFTALAGYRRMQAGGGPCYVFGERTREAAEEAGSAGEEAGEKNAAGEAAGEKNTAGKTAGEAAGEKNAAEEKAGEEAGEKNAAAEKAEGKDPGGKASGTPAGGEATDGRGGILPREPFYFAIGGLAVLFCLISFLRKKRNPRTYAFILAVAALAAAAVSMTEIRTPESYYAAGARKAENSISTVISIRCDTVAGRNEWAPADGVILGETEILIGEGQSAFDQLLEATRLNHIQMEYDGTAEGAYIRGIGYLYEYNFGNLSGWMFRVNGTFADVGASRYTLKAGDRVEWVYTTDIGRDAD